MEQLIFVENILHIFGVAGLKDYETKISCATLAENELLLPKLNQYIAEMRKRKVFKSSNFPGGEIIDTPQCALSVIQKCLHLANIPFKIVHAKKGKYLRLKPQNSLLTDYMSLNGVGDITSIKDYISTLNSKVMHQKYQSSDYPAPAICYLLQQRHQCERERVSLVYNNNSSEQAITQFYLLDNNEIAIPSWIGRSGDLICDFNSLVIEPIKIDQPTGMSSMIAMGTGLIVDSVSVKGMSFVMDNDCLISNNMEEINMENPFSLISCPYNSAYVFTHFSITDLPSLINKSLIVNCKYGYLADPQRKCVMALSSYLGHSLNSRGTSNFLGDNRKILLYGDNKIVFNWECCSWNIHCSVLDIADVVNGLEVDHSENEVTQIICDGIKGGPSVIMSNGCSLNRNARNVDETCKFTHIAVTLEIHTKFKLKDDQIILAKCSKILSS